MGGFNYVKENRATVAVSEMWLPVLNSTATRRAEHLMPRRCFQDGTVVPFPECKNGIMMQAQIQMEGIQFSKMQREPV